MSSAGQYADFDEYIEYQIKKTRAGIKVTELLTAGLVISVFVLAYLLVFTLLDHWVVPGGFSVRTRGILMGLVLLLSIGWIMWRLVLPWLRNVSGLYAAKAIEEADPQIKSAVLNLIDARNSGREIPPHILKAMEKRAAIRLSKTNVDAAVDRSHLMKFAYMLLGLVVVCCLYTVLSPKPISFMRALSMADTAVATRTEFLEIQPGDIEVLAGEFVEVTVDLSGTQPEEVAAYCTTEDRGLVDEKVTLYAVDGEDGRYRGRINGANGRGILQPMTYRIVAGDAESRQYQISVIAAPSAVMDRVEVKYPDYMDFPPATLPGGEVETWEGADLTFHARTNMPVSRAMLQFADTPDSKAEELRMEIVDGRNLSVQWKAKARSDGSFPKHYRVLVESDGQKDPAPVLYGLKVKPDLAPEVELFDPIVDLEMPADAVVPLVVKARDKDFKLRSVTLKLQKDGEELPPEEVIFDGFERGFRRSVVERYEFQLRPRRLQPGDTISMSVEARDNKPPLGNKATSASINIRIIEPLNDEEKVQEKLQKDKQEQQERVEERQQQGDPQDGEGDPEDRNQDDPREGDPDDRGDGEPGEEQDPNAEGSPDGKSGTGENSNNSGENTENSDPNGSGEGQQSRDDKAADDEALNKLIERMRERQQEQQQNQGDNSDQQNAPQDEQDNAGGQGDRKDDPSKGASGQQQTGDEGNSKPSGNNTSEQQKPELGSSEGAEQGENSATPDGPNQRGKNPEGGNDRGSGENQRSSDQDDPKRQGANEGSDSNPDAANQDTRGKEGQQQEPGAEGSQDNTGREQNQQPGDDRTQSGDNRGKQPGEAKGTEQEPGLDGQQPEPGKQGSENQQPGESTQRAAEDQGAKSKQPQDAGSQRTEPSDQKTSEPKAGDQSEQEAGDPNGSQNAKGQQQPKADPNSKEPNEGSSSKQEAGEQKRGERTGSENSTEQKTSDQGKPGQKQEADGSEDNPSSGKGMNKQGETNSQSEQQSQKAAQDGTGEQKAGDNKQSDNKQQEGGQKQSGNKQQEGGQKQSGNKQQEGGQKQSGNKQQEGGQKQSGNKQQEGGQKQSGNKQQEGGQKQSGNKQQEGGQKQSGNKQQEGGQKQGGKQGGDQAGKGGQNPSGSKDGKGQGSQSGGKGGKSSSAGASSGGQGGSGRSQDVPEGEGGGENVNPDDLKPTDKDLQDAKKAANLVLRQIEDDMKRGKVDQKTLKELGWSQEDLKRFSERLRKQLNANEKSATPQSAQKQREFEEMLKSLNLKPRKSDRTGSKARDRITEGVNVRQSAPPADLREAFEAYKRSLSKRRRRSR